MIPIRVGCITMSTLGRCQVVEIAHCFSRGLQPQHVHKLALRPPCFSMIRKGEGIALESKSQGSASRNQNFPTCQKCCKNHPRESRVVIEGFFGCG